VGNFRPAEETALSKSRLFFDIVKRWINTVAFKRLHALPKYGHG
jgi:hypothetical protein